MEQYFLANDVKVNLQVPTLLACVGDATYELMVDLCSPRKPGEMKFSELVQLVKKHIQPTPSVLAERDCEFKDNLEENLRDQFVCGLSSESTRQRLFCEDSVTFTVAFKKAVALEAAANDAAVVEQQAAEGAVHAVQARGARAAVAVRGAAPRWRGEASSSRVRYSGGYTNNRDRSIKLLCACCGSREHTRLTCKYADWTCRICLKPGHLKRVCPNVSKKPEGQVLRLDTARSGVLNGCDDISSEHASSAGEYDDEGTGGPSGLYMVQLTGSEPVMAEVTVAKRRLTMHVDTVPAVFSGKLGCLRSQRATLRVRAGAAPVFRRARPLPLALRADVDAELQRMQAADDILITGKTEHEHVRNLHSVFERLAKEGLTVRQEKCNFFEKEVSYLGFIISEHGVRTDDRKTEAVVKAPKPENITELKSFLGMVNFYAKFIKNISILLAPLYALLRKGVEWQWTEAQDRAFQEVKAALTSCPVLVHYDERLPLIVSCDASARGVGAVLSQRGEGGERPVSYASRTLNSAECNYSQIQREALAIIFAVKKFHTYLYGRRFVLRTDHQPLIAIFGSKKDIPHMASGRLIRWAILLSGYQYDIEYVQSKANSADALSRLPIDTGEENNDANTFIKFIENKFPIDSNQIKIESGKDKCISRILEFVKTGWPKSGFKEPDQEMTAYWRRREELYVENGCRVVVPRALRPAVLAELHGSHLGMVKCKGLARSFVFWPGLDNDLERMCSACRTCGEVADLPPKAPVVPWSWPSNPFDRVHIDFFSFRNITYLILVDAYSKWIEVSPMSTTTASNTILKLKEIFSRFGICRVLVSDNGPPFSSEEFKLFLKNNGIKHVTSAPYHPASNGEVENAVRTVKRSLKKADVEKICIFSFLHRFLLDYRNSIHGTTGDTPARLMFGRHLRSRLDLLKSGIVESVSDRLQQRALAKGGTFRCWVEGDKVWAKDFRKNKSWCSAIIIGRKGQNMYEVETVEGLRWNRHTDQLRSNSAVDDRDSSTRDGQPTVSAQAALADYAIAGNGNSAMDVDVGESHIVTSPVPNKRDRRQPVRFGFD
ncbi:uncharacterized protein K02A2.6-like [Pararge aegeria]|uniref:uncharacterized protein K02A2.6-like n=1 Tax=Pararge aegeria TaxID=116150 RepID=UPI0019D2C9C7|nr:uncharacterized protein K02A2.6-like [Pararge aegeria]